MPSKQHHPRALRLCPCNPGKAYCFAQCCSLSPSYGFSFSYMCGQPCLVAETVKNLPAMQETQVRSLDPGEDPLEKGMAMHSSIVAWRNPWIEEPGRLQSVGLQTVRHDGATNTFTLGSSKSISNPGFKKLKLLEKSLSSQSGLTTGLQNI